MEYIPSVYVRVSFELQPSFEQSQSNRRRRGNLKHTQSRKFPGAGPGCSEVVLKQDPKDRKNKESCRWFGVSPV